jgi:disulfide bond formation protein DsbB
MGWVKAMPQMLNDLLRKPEEQIFLVLIACAAVLIAALGLQYIWGYQPCELCLKERYAYYAGIVLAVLASAAMGMGRNGVGAALMAGAGLSRGRRMALVAGSEHLRDGLKRFGAERRRFAEIA